MGAYSLYREMIAGSTSTTSVVCVEGATEITLNLRGASSSTFSLQMSNAPRDAAIPEASWSFATTVTNVGNGIPLNVEPGMRWLRALHSDITAADLLAHYRF